MFMVTGSTHLRRSVQRLWNFALLVCLLNAIALSWPVQVLAGQNCNMMIILELTVIHTTVTCMI